MVFEAIVNDGLSFAEVLLWIIGRLMEVLRPLLEPSFGLRLMSLLLHASQEKEEEEE